MVNKPLIRPYFWGGYVRGGVGWLAMIFVCTVYRLFIQMLSDISHKHLGTEEWQVTPWESYEKQNQSRWEKPPDSQPTKWVVKFRVESMPASSGCATGSSGCCSDTKHLETRWPNGHFSSGTGWKIATTTQGHSCCLKKHSKQWKIHLILICLWYLPCKIENLPMAILVYWVTG